MRLAEEKGISPHDVVLHLLCHVMFLQDTERKRSTQIKEKGMKNVQDSLD